MSAADSKLIVSMLMKKNGKYNFTFKIIIIKNEKEVNNVVLIDSLHYARTCSTYLSF